MSAISNLIKGTQGNAPSSRGGAIQRLISTPPPPPPQIRQAPVYQPQQPAPQQGGFDWGGLGKNILNIGKSIVEAPFTIPMKATMSALEPFSGVRQMNVPLIGNMNTYQQEARQNIANLPQNASGLQKAEAVVGSAAQPAIDIGSLIAGGGAGAEALSGKQALLNSLMSGGKLGAGYGLIGGMQQGQNIPGLLKSTAIGAGTGAVAGGALHGLLSGVGRIAAPKDITLAETQAKTE
jgi:hypothetical protein